MASAWGASFGVSWGNSWGALGSASFDSGGIALTRGQLKRHKRKLEEERRKREAGWEAGLLASKELVDQVRRAMGLDAPSLPTDMLAIEDDEDEEIEMLLLS